MRIISQNEIDKYGLDCVAGRYDSTHKKAIELEQKISIEMASNLTYTDKRISEYGSISDQLDMIYWDKVNGTDLWKDHISGIKLKYPKE